MSPLWLRPRRVVAQNFYLRYPRRRERADVPTIRVDQADRHDLVLDDVIIGFQRFAVLGDDRQVGQVIRVPAPPRIPELIRRWATCGLTASAYSRCCAACVATKSTIACCWGRGATCCSIFYGHYASICFRAFVLNGFYSFSARSISAHKALKRFLCFPIQG